MKTKTFAPLLVRATTKKGLDAVKREKESYSDTIDRVLTENKKVVLEA